MKRYLIPLLLLPMTAGGQQFLTDSNTATLTNKTLADVSNNLDLEGLTLTNIADNEMLVGTGAGTASFVSIPGCASYQKPNFDGSAWSCPAVSIRGDLAAGVVQFVQSATPTPTLEGRCEWDTDDDELKCGDGTGTVTVGPGGGGMASWIVQGDDTNTATITDGETVDIAGELGLQTTVATGSPEQVTVDWDYSQTLAGNPALGIDECIFSTDGTGGGLLCEGTAADTFEGLLVFPVTSSDKTLTLPDATDTLVGRATTDTLTNKTIDGDNNTLSNLDLGNEVDWAVISDVSDRTAFTTGDKVLIFEAGVGMRKVDYDDLPGAGGGMTSWVIQADDTNSASITDGETLDIAGELGLQTTFATGSPEQLTVDWDYSQTLAGNPALGIDECIFSTDGTGGGLLCEGTAADAFEGLLVFPVTTSDKTLTLPDATDTLVGRDTTDTLTNKTIAAASNAIDLEGVALTNILDNQVLTGTGAGTATYLTVPGCASYQHLTFDGSAWSCPAFSIRGDLAAGDITLVQSATPTPTADGRIEWDSDDDHIVAGDGADQVVFVPTEDVSGDATMTTAGAVTVSQAANAGTLDTIDSTGFAILAGQAGGQTLIGGTGVGDDLTLQTTSNASKGSYILTELDCSAGDQYLTTNASGVIACGTDDSAGSPSFDGITGGTNTSATMIVGSGAVLETDGGGIFRLDDTDSTFNLGLASSSTITTADKTLTFDVNDANRTLTIGADTTLSGGTHSGTNTGDNDEVGTLTNGNLCINDGSVVNCTVNTEGELETALGGLDVVTVTTDDITSANLATLVSNETGTGVVVFGTSPTFTTSISVGAAVADAGVIRLDNAATIEWEAAPAGTNGTLTFDSSEVFQLTGGKLDNADVADTVQTVAWNAGALVADGTQCADPAAVTINSGPKIYTIICTDNAASIFYGSTPMGDGWDGGTVVFQLQALNTAADTNVLDFDFSAQCRGDSDTVNSTWGTVQNASITFSTANDIEMADTLALTPDGTCAAGDTLFWRAVMDDTATTTAVATAHIVAVRMEYTTALSD